MQKEQMTQKQPQKANIFELLKPYRGMIIILALLALAGNALSLFLPKVISGGIDTFIGGTFSYRTTILDFSLLALGVFIFSLMQNFVQTYASEKVAKALRTKLSGKISRSSY